jgi:trimethylamine---corrinoid protein Co-methyltransferase
MEMLVMADEIIREMRYVAEGIEVSERTLARAAIHEARPGGGFLANEHTLANWKWAQWKPSLMDRSRYDRWVEAGRQDMTARANKKARSILAEHKVAPLPANVEKVIAAELAKR